MEFENQELDESLLWMDLLVESEFVAADHLKDLREKTDQLLIGIDRVEWAQSPYVDTLKYSMNNWRAPPYAVREP